MSANINYLQKKYLKAKKELREWELTFQKKHHRPPTVQDIGERPSVEKYYKKYNQLKKDYKLAMEQNQDEPKPSSVEFANSNTEPFLNNNKKQQDSKMTEEQAFWLCDTGKTSMSQPITPKTEERLILGGSQPIPKKNIMLEQKLFGHLMQNPRSNNNNTIVVEQPKEEEEEDILNTQDIPMMMSDDEDDFQVMDRELNHFRHYFQTDLPPSSIGPGFFNKATCAIPLFDDESEKQRRERILYKLEKGTLGERVEENRMMEDEMDDDIKAFLSRYDSNNMLHESNNEEMSSSQPSSPGSSTSSSPYYSKYNPNKPYKKKPIQRRQTRLYKLKFVETR